MSPTQPTQPNQPQYQISALDLFPVYSTRAVYQQATGQQAPPFESTQSVKGWADPAPTGQPYLVFDSTAAATGYISQLTLQPAQAVSLNLPGAYNYPALIVAPTDALEVGPFGAIGPASPDMICLQSDAEAVAAALAPVFPGQSLTVFETMKAGQSTYYYTYPSGEQRRCWAFQATINGFPITLYAQQLIEAQSTHGVGAPGQWTLTTNGPAWIYNPPVTAAPPDAVTLPAPIRPLLPNEQIVHLAGSLFNPAGTWVVERTDLPQPGGAATPPETTAQQLAALQAAVAALQAALSALEKNQGGQQ